MENKPFHIQVIQEALGRKQRTNASYSLRAYSRDLEMDPSTLSQVINGKRPLPTKDCEKVATKLRLTPLERMKFVESALKKQVLLDRLPILEQADRFMLDESNYRIIAEWEHYAVITLCDLPNFKLTARAVSERLAISAIRAESVVQNLFNAGLIQKEKDHYTRVHQSLRTSEDISSAAIRESHFEALELGRQKLETVAVEKRDYSSMNFAFDTEQMIELKAVIREFRKKVASLSRQSKKPSEVYQLAIQAYPLTQSRPQTQTKTKKTKEK